MATIPLFDNQLLPVAEGGETFAISQQYREAVLPGMEASNQKYEAAIGLGKVAQAWGNKITEARDAKALSDAKLRAEEKLNGLLSTMQSPEFREKNHWSTYDKYYVENSEKIRSDILGTFAGTPRAKEAMDMSLRDLNNNGKVRANAFTRNGEINEMRSDVGNKLNKYQRIATLADKNNDPDAVQIAMTDVDAMLKSYVKAGVLGGAEYDGLTRQFSNSVNKSIWENRILDAIDLEDNEQSVGRLKALSTRLSDVVPGMDDDIRPGLRQMAMSALRSKLAEGVKIDYEQQALLKRDIDNSISAAKDGNLAIIPLDRFVGVYGNKQNKAKGEYIEYYTRMQHAGAEAFGKEQVNNMSPENYTNWVSENRPDPSDAKNYSLNRAAFEAGVEQMNKNITILNNDPAGAATDPKIGKIREDDYNGILSYQQRMKISEDKMSLLANDNAKRIKLQLEGMSPDKALDEVDKLRREWGQYSSIGFRDLQKQGLPFALEWSGRLEATSAKDRDLAKDMITANKRTDKQWNETLGPDAMNRRLLVETSVHTAFQPYRDALNNAAASSADLNKIDEMEKAITNLSLYRVSENGDWSNRAKIIGNSVNEVMGQYTLYNNNQSRYQIKDTERFMLPKSYGFSQGQIDKVKVPLVMEEAPNIIAGVNREMKRMGVADDNLINTPEKAEAYMLESFIPNSYWATDNKKDGLLLMHKSGLSIPVSPERVRELYNKTTTKPNLPPTEEIPEPITVRPTPEAIQPYTVREQNAITGKWETRTYPREPVPGVPWSEKEAEALNELAAARAKRGKK